jgi:hypothetical protein
LEIHRGHQYICAKCLAAVLIDGSTIQKQLGIGINLDHEKPEYELPSDVRAAWVFVCCVILDESSMLGAHLLEVTTSASALSKIRPNLSVASFWSLQRTFGNSTRSRHCPCTHHQGILHFVEELSKELRSKTRLSTAPRSSRCERLIVRRVTL